MPNYLYTVSYETTKHFNYTAKQNYYTTFKPFPCYGIQPIYRTREKAWQRIEELAKANNLYDPKLNKYKVHFHFTDNMLCVYIFDLEASINPIESHVFEIVKYELIE